MDTEFDAEFDTRFVPRGASSPEARGLDTADADMTAAERVMAAERAMAKTVVMPVNPRPTASQPAHAQANPSEVRIAPELARADASMVKQVGRYQVLELVGRGGMANVYKAYDPGIGRWIALKFLHGSLCEDETYRLRFLREARAAGMLAHTNIAAVHDVGEIEGRPYIAMEFLEGEVLSEVMSRRKVFPVREVVDFGIQLARALDYAHAKGIVHRDIKPANIVLLKGSHHVKVMDFGIAHMSSAAVSPLTIQGDLVGTPAYMSPEQTLGRKVDGRSDLFSAGAVLYQMLTGHQPFDGRDLIELLKDISSGNPPTISSARNDVPASLRRVVDRCLAKQPDKRFQSAGELAEALVRVQQEIDEEARGARRARMVSLRVRWTMLMAGVVAVVMAVTASFVTHRQYVAMMDQVMDDGASLARFVALQSAVPLLSEDWVSLDVGVRETMNAENFKSIAVVDRLGKVRAATDRALIGSTYLPPSSDAVAARPNGVTVTRYVAHGERILGFEAPVTFQGKRLGLVQLGIAEAPLSHVARLSMMLMLVLVSFTVGAVALATYFLANWFSRPIKLLEESMTEIGKGRFDYRIGESRNDEFGLLYRAFDEMAASLALNGIAPPALNGTAAATAVNGTAAAPALNGIAAEQRPGTPPAPGAQEVTPADDLALALAEQALSVGGKGCEAGELIDIGEP